MGHAVADDYGRSPLEGPERGLGLALHAARAHAALVAELNAVDVLGVERVDDAAAGGGVLARGPDGKVNLGNPKNIFKLTHWPLGFSLRGKGQDKYFHWALASPTYEVSPIFFYVSFPVSSGGLPYFCPYLH